MNSPCNSLLPHCRHAAHRERTWKVKQAKRFAGLVKRSNMDVESRAVVRQQEEAAAVRRRAAWVAKQVGSTGLGQGGGGGGAWLLGRCLVPRAVTPAAGAESAVLATIAPLHTCILLNLPSFLSLSQLHSTGPGHYSNLPLARLTLPPLLPPPPQVAVFWQKAERMANYKVHVQVSQASFRGGDGNGRASND